MIYDVAPGHVAAISSSLTPRHSQPHQAPRAPFSEARVGLRRNSRPAPYSKFVLVDPSNEAGTLQLSDARCDTGSRGGRHIRASQLPSSRPQSRHARAVKAVYNETSRSLPTTDKLTRLLKTLPNCRRHARRQRRQCNAVRHAPTRQRLPAARLARTCASIAIDRCVRRPSAHLRPRSDRSVPLVDRASHLRYSGP
ncbi:hypothetical protein WOLCODRAFT_158421 [Wolfiporia cocos MD-104 SS10]|uniref:Uncharacterized protein n=1 Tax=Wolfiporia cocos (strain MD-104) TaxID=742152 RepID=A0A2H3J9H9_WOLCO|nr:hypothetical protein WOLCODRAFT_158421 [Wolfiporia cocos MD-104 SS10]